MRVEVSACGGPPPWACPAAFGPQIRRSRSWRRNSFRRIDFFCGAYSFLCAFVLIQKHQKIKHGEKQRVTTPALSDSLCPIPTEVPCGHFWRHLLVTKSGKNCSSQETPNRRCGMLPDIHSGCFRRFHTPILLKLTIVKDSLFDCGRRAAARSRSMRRAASFRHRRSKHSPPAVGRQTIIQLHIPDGLQSALASESSRISSSGWRADCKNSFVS